MQGLVPPRGASPVHWPEYAALPINLPIDHHLVMSPLTTVNLITRLLPTICRFITLATVQLTHPFDGCITFQSGELGAYYPSLLGVDPFKKSCSK